MHARTRASRLPETRPKGERGGKREERERGELETGRRKGVGQTDGNGKWKMCGNAAQKGISNFETCSMRITERARERGKDREEESDR